MLEHQHIQTHHLHQLKKEANEGLVFQMWKYSEYSVSLSKRNFQASNLCGILYGDTNEINI